MRVAILFFQPKSLRIADHEPLLRAATYDAVVPLFLLDPVVDVRARPDASLVIPRLGPHRLGFLLDAVRSLDRDLSTRYGHRLLFRCAPVAQVMREVVTSLHEQVHPLGRVDLLAHHATCPDSSAQAREAHQAFAVAAEARGIAHAIHLAHTATLHHPDDLFPPIQGGGDDDADRYASLPRSMTAFRTQLLDKAPPIRAALDPPIRLPPPLPASIPHDPIPSSIRAVYESDRHALSQLETLESLIQRPLLSASSPCPHHMYPFQASEAAAHERLAHYVQSDKNPSCPLATYAESRAMATGMDASSKLSAYLSLGLLSSRHVFEEARRVRDTTPTDSPLHTGAQWLQMHLQIRDFFLYTAIKHESTLTRHVHGLRDPSKEAVVAAWVERIEQLDPATRQARFQAWASGRTGIPYIDASMRELAATGYMSNRGRQNVANFLAHGLSLDWRLGMQLFESLLIDHDAGINAASWAYQAGAGNDQRVRRMHVVQQGETYEAEALIRAWIPELEKFDDDAIHRPWMISSHGGEYPAPIVDPSELFPDKKEVPRSKEERRGWIKATKLPR